MTYRSTARLRGAPGTVFAAGRKLIELPALPRAVRRFYARVLFRAIRLRDGRAIRWATSPRDLTGLLRVVEGRLHVVELGTAHGWTSLALALADPSREVRTLDTRQWDTRAAYLELVPADVRGRVSFVEASAVDPVAPDVDIDAVFVDAGHGYEAVVACFESWRNGLRPGGLMVFHDFGNPAYPGVARAVADLGLAGSQRGGLFVWEKSAS